MPFLPFFFFICFQPSGQRRTGKQVVVSGVIRNTKAAEIKVGEFSSPLDSQGQFSLGFDLDEADYFKLECGEKFVLFLTPGDHLIIDADAADWFGNLAFSGVGAQANNFLAEQAIREEEHNRAIAPIIQQIFAQNEKEFTSQLDVFNSKFLDPLEEFLEKNRTDRFLSSLGFLEGEPDIKALRK